MLENHASQDVKQGVQTPNTGQTKGRKGQGIGKAQQGGNIRKRNSPPAPNGDNGVTRSSGRAGRPRRSRQNPILAARAKPAGHDGTRARAQAPRQARAHGMMTVNGRATLAPHGRTVARETSGNPMAGELEHELGRLMSPILGLVVGTWWLVALLFSLSDLLLSHVEDCRGTVSSCGQSELVFLHLIELMSLRQTAGELTWWNLAISPSGRRSNVLRWEK